MAFCLPLNVMTACSIESLEKCAPSMPRGITQKSKQGLRMVSV
jgi:hypothetical protein